MTATLRACALGLLSALALTTAATPAETRRPSPVDLNLAYERFTLKNGLTVLVHTDRSAPVVAVDVLYKVGSQDEREGRTGFAHLFEHLMFRGSQHHPKGFDGPLREAGASRVNANTWWDYTNFFETVPTGALELALFLESDRMGYLPAGLTQEALDRERGVVQNELRQKENGPYGRVEPLILRSLFPPGHPFRWSPLGVLEDLDAATLDDVRAWFARHYGPNNAILVLAGDVDAAQARPLVEKYFGEIAPGPPATRAEAFAPTLPSPRRENMTDAVSAARIYRTWPAPGADDPDAPRLDLAAAALADGEGSRLFDQLVRKEGLASFATVAYQKADQAGALMLIVTLKPGVDPAAARARLDDALRDFATNGPSAAELEAAKARLRLRAALETEGASGKVVALALGELYHGDPRAEEARLKAVAEASAASVAEAARRWLGPASYELTVVPAGPLSSDPAGDRSRLPAVAETRSVELPALDRRPLANGLELVVVEQPGAAVTRVALQIPGGAEGDPPGKTGLGALVLDLLDEAPAAQAASRALGAPLQATSAPNAAELRVSATSAQAGEAMRALAAAVAAPVTAAELERKVSERTAQIAQEWAQPVAAGQRLMPAALFGPAVGRPWNGSGGRADLASLTLADVEAYRRERLRPERARLVVVGGLSPAKARRLAEAAFGGWNAGAAPATAAAPPAAAGPQPPRLILVDRPGAGQSVLLAGYRTPADLDPVVLAALNAIMGQAPWSRANTELRETRGWAYYAQLQAIERDGDDALTVVAPVQADKTVEAARVLREVLAGPSGAAPIREEEAARAVRTETLALSGRYAAGDALISAVLTNLRLGRPDDALRTSVAQYRRLSRAELQAAAGRVFGPGPSAWVIVTDVAKYGDGLRALGLADEVEVIRAAAQAHAKDNR